MYIFCKYEYFSLGFHKLFPDAFNSLGSLLFHHLPDTASVSDLATSAALDISALNPYDSSSAGLDITGDGIVFDFQDEVAFVRGFRLPKDLAADVTISVKILVENIDATQWFWPENAEGDPGN